MIVGLRRGFSSLGFEQGKPSEHDQFVNSVIRDVAELPHRTSPDNEPHMMMVTAEELKTILCTRLAEALGFAPLEPAVALGHPPYRPLEE